MALIPTIKPTAAGAVAAFVASTPGGDKVGYGGGELLIEFINGHASSITVTIVPVATSAIAPGVGPVTPPTKTLVLATTVHGIIGFKRGEVSAYQDTNGEISIAYTSGNAALLVRPVEIN